MIDFRRLRTGGLDLGARRVVFFFVARLAVFFFMRPSYALRRDGVAASLRS
jgi:hypothetical protein